jgi:uncharacterized protein (DUF2147 family)
MGLAGRKRKSISLFSRLSLVLPFSLSSSILPFSLSSAVLPFSLSSPAQSATPVGRWKTIDDKTGVAKSIVSIAEVNGELQGKVEQVFAPPAPKADPRCERCSGERKDKPIVGMTIMWGLKKSGDEFTGGQVLDPETGKTYRCKLRVIDNGGKLELRGFIGFSLIGRTQTWVRERS